MSTHGEDAQAAALELIKALAAAGHSVSFVAEALRRACIPTARGKAHWSKASVVNLATKHDIRLGMRLAG
jgi:hypothetical protein